MKQAHPAFQVIYEDNHLLIVNKANGVLVQGDSTGDPTLLDYGKEYIREKYDKPGNVFLKAAHRLDRPVSGLVVLGRTSKGIARMVELFKKRKIQKIYWAVVKRRPPEMQGKLVHWLWKNSEKNRVTAFDFARENTQRAELRYKVLGKLNDHYLLEIEPLTGRPHQIRVQLSEIGCPIRGDIKYGFSKPNPDASINLHARRLFFEHPIKQQKLTLIAPLPENQFWEQFLTLDNFEVKDKHLEP